MVELRADSHERPPRIERLAEHAEQRRPLLEHLEQPLVALELAAVEILEQARGPADVEALLLGGERFLEQRPQRGDEPGLAGAERGLVEPAAQPAAAELEAGDAVVQVLRGPVDETGIDGLAETEDPLRDAARGG